MAHEFESGFFVAQAAWHGLGTVLQDAPTTQTAIAQAGLNWRVEEEPIFQTGITDTVLKKRLVRVGFASPEENRDRQELGIVNPDYVPLQNEDAFRWFDPLLSTGQLQLEAAGSLQQGKRIWVLAKITCLEASVRYDDWVRPYLLLHNSHDGSTAVWLQFTPVRVVCMNTLAGAAGHRFGDLWQKKAVVIPHDLSLTDQMAKVQNLVDLTRREFQVCVEEYQAMDNQEVNQELLHSYIGSVFGRLPLRSLRDPIPGLPTQQQLIENFERGRGNQGRTLWDAYNAVTEWIDHQSARSPEQRLGYTWFNDSMYTIRHQAHQAALNLIRQVRLNNSMDTQTIAVRDVGKTRSLTPV